MRKPSPPPGNAAARRPAGFTFLELLIVMGLLAVLLGLGIGFIVNVGRQAQSEQAAATVVDAAFRCQNMSAGQKRATMEIRKEGADEAWYVVTGVQRPVLTANFEAARKTTDGKSDPMTAWLVNVAGDVASAGVGGNVTADPDGQAGSAALFSSGGTLDFGNRAAFAVTHGLDVDVWVKPAAGSSSRMTILRADASGEELWTLLLQRGQGSGGPDAYKVELRLRLLSEKDTGSSPPMQDDYVTVEACVAASRWSQVRATFDGRDASIRVNGVERTLETPRRAKDASPEGKRFVVPPSGAAHLQASHSGGPFVGSMDTLQVSGVFRTDEDVRRLGAGMALKRNPTGPIRLHFANGRLDPMYHAWDEILEFETPSDQAERTFWRVRIGLYGSIQPAQRVLADYDVPPSPGAQSPSPEGRPK